MKSLTVKEIRDTLEETLFKFYSIQDWSVNPTKVMDRSKEFRVEFRIYDAEFWIDIDPGIHQVYVATRSFRGPDNIDSIHIWLYPYQYDKNSFEFAWRKDLEVFFDAFCEALMEKFKRINAKTSSAAVYGSSTKAAEIGEGEAGASVIAAILDGLDTKKDETKDCNKPSIFNSLKDGEDEYI